MFRAEAAPLPQTSGFLDQTSLGAVARQHFGLVLGNLGELALEGFRELCTRLPLRRCSCVGWLVLHDFRNRLAGARAFGRYRLGAGSWDT